jgi:hypothetical protein
MSQIVDVRPADLSSAYADAVLPLQQGCRLDEERFLKQLSE